MTGTVTAAGDGRAGAADGTETAAVDFLRLALTLGFAATPAVIAVVLFSRFSVCVFSPL